MLRSTRSKVRVGVQSKPEGPMGYAFRRILGMAGASSPILSSLGLGTSLVFGFGMLFGAVKILSNPLPITICDSSSQRGFSVRSLGIL